VFINKGEYDPKNEMTGWWIHLRIKCITDTNMNDTELPRSKRKCANSTELSDDDDDGDDDDDEVCKRKEKTFDNLLVKNFFQI